MPLYKLHNYKKLVGGPFDNRRIQALENAYKDAIGTVSTIETNISNATVSLTVLTAQVTSIDGRVTTLEGSTVTPGGNNGELQYKNGSSFAGWSGSYISGLTLTLGGGFNIINFNSDLNFGATDLGITFYGAAEIKEASSGGTIDLFNTGGNTYAWRFSSLSDYSYSSGNRVNVGITPVFKPTTGSTSTFEAMRIVTTIDQSVGAGSTGTTYGIRIAPTLISPDDWIALAIDTGVLKLGVGTTTHASLNIPDGAAKTSPVDGDMWRIGDVLYLRDGGTTKSITFT